MIYTFSQLEDLWVQAGGNPQNKAMAAAIAMAESGGDPQSTNHNTNGTVDRGLWQINSNDPVPSTYDPLGSARSAVQMSNGGSNWRPWCTAYSDALCGTQGGTYLGSGAPFMKFLNGQSTGPLGSGNSGGVSTPAQQVGAVQNAAWYNWLFPFTSPGGGILGSIPLGGFSNVIESGIAGALTDILKPVGRAILHAMFVVGGIIIMALGISIMTGISGLSSGRTLPGDGDESPADEEKELETEAEEKPPAEPQEPRRSRRAPSPGLKPSESAPGRHRGAPAREGRTQKAAKSAAAKKAVEGAVAA